MGDHDFKLKKVHLYAQRPVNINFLCSADPKLALVPASRYDCHILHTKQDAFFCSKISEYHCFAVCCPKTSSCASKPSKLLCKLVIRQFLFQVSLGLKEVQMGAHDFKLNMLLLFARKPGYNNVSRSAAPKLALMPASCFTAMSIRQFSMSVLSFIRIERGSNEDHSSLLE